MDTVTRVGIYTRNSWCPTPRQKRRIVKKAGRDGAALVDRSHGMGVHPARQGERIFIGYAPRIRPVSGIPAS